MITRRCAWLGAVVFLPILSFAAEVQIKGIPSPNLVKNPSIEEVAKDQPKYWTFDSALKENFIISWTHGGRTGKKSLGIKTQTGKMSGYWTQIVVVESERTYLFKGYYRLGGGRILIWVSGEGALPDKTKVKVDRRFYAASSRGHWLEPVFLPPEALSGPDPDVWLPFEIEVKVPAPITHLAFNMGLYFSHGKVYFDDLWVGLAEMDLDIDVKAAPEERIDRVVIRSAEPAKDIFDSGPLAKAKNYEKTLKALPMNATYEVLVHLADGKVVRKVYSHSENEKGR